MKFYILLFILFFMISGCKTYEPPMTISMYGRDMYYSPKPLEAVQVFHNKPPGRYIEIGELTVEGVYNLNRAKDALRKKAAELGGDAVYIVNILTLPENPPVSYGLGYGHRHHSHSYHYGHHRVSSYEYTVTGVVIRYSR